MNQFGVLALGSRFKRLSDMLFSEVESLYKALDIPISPANFPLLRLLQITGEMTVVEIAEHLGISHPAVSKQINKLLAEELITKTSDKSDNRRSFLCLSDKGMNVFTKLEPVLAAMKNVLEQEAYNIDSRLLQAFDQYESRLLSMSLKDEALQRIYKEQPAVEISPWDECYAADFKRLNQQWLEEFFPQGIEEKDLTFLSHPQSEVLAQGGYIWFAVLNYGNTVNKAAKVVGTCALIPAKSRESSHKKIYEVVKLAVDPAYQGQGIGMRLMLACIEKARAKKAHRLTLESNRKLKAALALYQRLGFAEKQPADGYSVARADIYMELTFPCEAEQ